MPPTSERSSFITVWVEDGQARLWRVETNSGAMDEIARFNVEGMTRPAVLELARLFIRGRGPQRPVLDELSNGAAPRPAKEAAKKKAAPGTYRPREEQIARQAELRAALSRHPEGITATALAEEMGRSRAGAGVPLGVLKRSGLATLDENGLWYPVDTAPDIAVE